MLYAYFKQKSGILKIRAQRRTAPTNFLHLKSELKTHIAFKIEGYATLLSLFTLEIL